MRPLVGTIHIGASENSAGKTTTPLLTTLTNCDLAPTYRDESKAKNSAKMAMGFTPTQYEKSGLLRAFVYEMYCRFPIRRNRAISRRSS